MAGYRGPDIEELLANNAAWAEKVETQIPGFFSTLAKQQAPAHLWIGCSDSRVPANQIVGLAPGELFVHRNVANLVQHSDLNCLSVVQFAVDVLKISHIMVTGHYGCGGVRAALRGDRVGLSDHWIRPVRDLYEDHKAELLELPDEDSRIDRLCELNVLRQARNLLRTQIVQDAWARDQGLAIHPLIYGLKNGRLRQLGPPIVSMEQANKMLRG